MVTLIASFGYKWGAPETRDPQIDVRPILTANPHNVPRLRELDGLDPKVIAWLLTTPGFHNKYLRLRKEAERLQDEATRKEMADPGHAQVLWIGCYGGRHRSVYIAERLGHDLGLKVEHRDLKKHEYKTGGGR